MKSIKIAGLCLAAMFTMGMALAGNAFAGPLWLSCLEGSSKTNTKYEDSSCTKANGTGKWESVPLAAGKSNTIRIQVFTLRLRDTKATGGESEIECNSDLTKDAGGGTISSPNTGQIVKAEITSSEVNKRCTRLKGSCKAGEIEEVHGVHLPWNTKLEEEEGEVRGKIENSGAGEPGWAVKCNTLLGTVTDTCESIKKEYEVLSMTNILTGGVLLIRNALLKLHNAECSQSKESRAGQVEAILVYLRTPASGIAVHKT